MTRPPLTLRKTVFTLLLLSGALVVVSLLSLVVGSVGMAPQSLWNALAGGGDSEAVMLRVIILEIRLPRVLLALVVGAGLSIAGATFQALLRNPLAEPYILGISSGGTMGAIVAMSLGAGMSYLTTPALSFAGSALVMMLVFGLGKRRGLVDPHALLLSGVMIGAFFNAMILVVVSIFQQELRTAYYWLLGNLSGADLTSLAVVGPIVIVASVVLMQEARSFNLIASGEETAMHLGVDVTRVQTRSYVVASLITGLAVSVSGVIGFVGLLVPHVCRLTLGPDNRLLLPASFLSGGIFLILCDVVARVALAPSELPVGAVTAVIGAPLFIYLLKKT